MTNFSVRSGLGIITLSLAAAALQAQNRYNDPGGRFSLSPPAGWTVNALNPDAVSLLRKDASVTVMIAGHEDPDATLAGLLQQYQSQWTSFQEIKRGDITVGGRAGNYVFASGKNPKGADAFLKLAAIASDAGTVVLLESTPQAGYAALKPVLEQIEQGVTLAGPGAKAFLGVGTRPVESEEARQLGLDRARGALVGQLYPRGPAEQSGLAAGDVITAADDTPIDQPQELVDLVARHHPGDVITLEVLRQGQLGRIKVRLGAPPSQ